MFQQKMTIRHEQAYYWFTIPRFKLKTKTCGKRDTSGRRGLFHTDQSALLSSRGSEGKNKVCFYSGSYFHNGQRVSVQKEVCLCIKQAFIHYLSCRTSEVCDEAWASGSLRGYFSTWDCLFVIMGFFFCHCDVVSLISRPCCCSWALSSALSFFRSSICCLSSSLSTCILSTSL